MKICRLLLLCLLCTSPLCAKFVPTPEMAMSFNMGKDPVKWVGQFMDGNAHGIIFEFVPPGQSVEAWKEMVEQQIAFTNASLRKYVDTWKALLLQADPKIELKEEPRDDDSILVTYTSLLAQEIGIRRFIKAQDGVYMIAYHVRPAFKDEARFKLWHDIAADASLVSNPQKKH